MNGPTETPKDAARRLVAGAIRDGFKPQALHEYTDCDGHPLHWRIRAKHLDTGDKWIRPMRLNGAGFELGEPEYPDGKPLYRLHDLTTRPGDPVIVCEGEWCADALVKAGALATTSGAADSAGKTDWRPLAGRTVTIWPDNDEAGGRYADAVADALLALGCTVRLIDVAALDLPPKGDAVDWLAANADATAADVLGLTFEEAPKRNGSGEQDPNTAGLSRGAVWPEPMPLLVRVTAEPYPLDALPDTIREAVEEVQGFTKAPIPLVVSAALGALSIAAQAHIDVTRADKLTGPVSLFLLTIADSGERKSTCDGIFTSEIRDYEAEQAKLAEPLMKDHAASLASWTAEREGVLLAIKQAAKTGKAMDTLKAGLKGLELEKPAAPRVPKLLRGDETPENLAWVLAKNWPSAGVISSEAGAVLGAHAMGKDTIMRNLALLNILWDGRELSIGRRTSESFTVRGARLTCGLMIQEPTLRSFFERSGGLARGTGFLARFLISWPESTQGFRPFTEAPANWPALATFNWRIAAILANPVPMDEDGALTPTILPLKSDAKTAWVAFHDAIEGELRNGGELHDVRDVASKTADNAVRLAALFQIFEHGTGGAVGLPAFEGASRIAAWYLNEARRFFGELALPVELANAARLDAWLIGYCRSERVTAVPKNHVRQHGPGSLRSKSDLDPALTELAESARVRLAKDGKRVMVQVNPALLGGTS